MAMTDAGKRNMKALGDGKPAVACPALTQTQLAPPAGGTGATAGAYDNATNRNLMITSLTAARTDIAAIMQILKDHGMAV